MEFREVFREATGNPPYAYQERLAAADPWPELLEAPTGAGKTEAIVLGWLWRRRFGPAETRRATPRRLVYTLPMRVLVEQTRNRVTHWMRKLGLAEDVRVNLLMGGETDDDWDLYPERDVVLIGTQDMLLSRALNRGYALSRARWPMPYGLLNNDSLWVFDEVQLMGSGLATTAQLAALRARFGVWGACPTLWVSATLRAEWLATVNHREEAGRLKRHALTDDEWSAPPLAERLYAPKRLRRAKHSAEDPRKLCYEIQAAHLPGTLTLVVVNTVAKAVGIFDALQLQEQPARTGKKGAVASQFAAERPELLLLHSRFRQPDRDARMAQLLKPAPLAGRIVIATQVVEAGVDISAQALFTELSPWASFVQRAGRCNRYGEATAAEVIWIDVNTKRKGAAAPYEADELDVAREVLQQMEDVGPASLRTHLVSLTDAQRQRLYPYAPRTVIRDRDVVGLFDTTPDLSGADIDVSRFIRDADDLNVHVFWRTWDGKDPNLPEPQSAPARDELCPAPLNQETRAWLKKQTAFVWDFPDSRWRQIGNLLAGQTIMLPAAAGGYSTEHGWDPASPRVEPVAARSLIAMDGNQSDGLSTQQGVEQTIAEHTDQVVEELGQILANLDATLTPEEHAVLRHAARWHDWGKAHDNFQRMLEELGYERTLPDGHLWAKSKTKGGRSERPGFRHELASALGMLACEHPDLACYVVAAHHGKVRLSIRSLATEKRPENPAARFARGVWDGDRLRPVMLGGGVEAPELTLSLAPMEFGLSEGRRSWAERALALRERYGPFRLAYLEALLRAADMRASANPRPGGEA